MKQHCSRQQKPWNNGSVAFLQGRELGKPLAVGQYNRYVSNMYRSVDVVHYWDPAKTSTNTHHGGIFNFDFSTDGSALVAACERRCFLVFDPFNGKLVQTKDGAHSNCVNCVRFLDTRTFATCSDDTTVALWDLRYLKHKIRSLQGHSSWVKNIEYASSLGLLVTSGFDGTIYTWDINNYSSEEGCRKVFYTNGLMRSKLTPDGSKLIIATSGGYLLIIHNLDLSTLDKDLADFSPHLYHITSVFEQQRNRVEIVADFPKGNKAEVIASLQVHPQGWCIASRNTSSEEESEWTCIHDIHDTPLVTDDCPGQGKGKCTHSSLSSSSSSSSSSSCSEDEANLLGSVALPRITFPLGLGPMPHGARPSRWGIYTIRNAVHTPSDSRPSDQSESVTAARTHQDNRERVEEARERESIAQLERNRMPADDSHSVDEIVVMYPLPRDSASDSGSSSDSVDGQSSEDELSDEEHIEHLFGQAHGNARSRRFSANRGSRRSFDDFLINMGRHQEEPSSIRPRRRRNARLTGNESVQDGSDSRSEGSSATDSPPAPRTMAEHRERLLEQILVRGDRRGGLASLYERQMVIPVSPNSDNLIGTFHQIRPRLLYYLREPNVGQGYIKEQCFSTDGRLVISPCGNGIRLLSFDPECQELCDCHPVKSNHSRPMHAFQSVHMHKNVSLTTKFSPIHCMFVSGSLDGSVAFLQPYH